MFKFIQGIYLGLKLLCQDLLSSLVLVSHDRLEFTLLPGLLNFG